MVSTATFISDSIKFLRDDLIGAITDPISAKRSSKEKFVLTAYPERNVKYPIITIRNEGSSKIQSSGMQSELDWMLLTFEIRIWAANEKQKDELTEQVLNRLRSNQHGASSSSDTEGLHDYDLVSTTPVDELGDAGVKSMVLIISYKVMLGE